MGAETDSSPTPILSSSWSPYRPCGTCPGVSFTDHEGVDPGRLRLSSVALVGVARRRHGADVRSGHRRANGSTAALPRADPAGTEGRRGRAVEARSGGRLRPGARTRGN